MDLTGTALPDRYRFGKLTSRLPTPAYLTAVPRASRTRLTRLLPIKDGGVLHAVEDVRIYMTAVPKHRETSAQWQRCGAAL
jgi:hypothetical protein